jgi:hypothetical protein
MTLKFRPVRRFWQTDVYRLAMAASLAIVSACASQQQPSLDRLYSTTRTLSDQAPVILVHGAFGARLCDSAGQEFWPGSLANLLFADYQELALPVGQELPESIPEL